VTKWIRYPGPGEFRGEGEWHSIDDLGVSEEKFAEYKESGFLPTHEGDAPPPKDG